MPHHELQRNTAQRQAIIEELRNMCSHPTATELHRIVRRKISNISLGTIYRNLEKLVKTGQARKLDVGKGEARFDAITEPHHHVRCSACGRLDDLEDAPHDSFSEEFISGNGYRIYDFKLEYIGICSSCSERNKTLESQVIE